MSDLELKRELGRLQTMVLALATGIMLFLGATSLMVIELMDATMTVTPGNSGVVLIATAGMFVFMFGAMYPELMWLWDRYRNRRSADQEVA